MTAYTPQQGLDCWVGDAFWQRPGTVYTLTAADRRDLAQAIAAAKQTGLPLTSIERQHFPITTFATVLDETADILEHGVGARWFHDLPVDDYDEDDLKRMFWGIGRHLGTPVSQSAKGERIFSVRDAGFGMENPKARGPNTARGLRFHTDRCDVIGFLCLQQAKSGGENELVSAKAVYNAILETRPDLLPALHEPYYYLRHTVDLANEKPYCRQPIFAEHEGRFLANVLRVLIDRAEAHPDIPNHRPDQMEALDYLDTIAEDPARHVRFRQKRGDMLLVNNFALFHRREAFEDHPDPAQRRHLLRLWLSMPNSRALPHWFACHYGNTAAGALRGGMKAQ